jgi:hypothetical protein
LRFLRQNTAVKITIGPFLDHADGLTPLIAMTEANLEGAVCYDADDGDAVTLVGAAHFHPSHHDAAGDNDMLYLAAGLWEMELTAAQTNYTGRMMLSLTDAAQICPVFHEFQVLAVNVYDSLFTGHGPTADLLDVNQAQVLGTAVHTSSENGTQCVEVVRWGGNDVAATGINGTPKVDVAAILGHAITQTGTQVADAFQTFFDVATPTGTVNLIPANVTQISGDATAADNCEADYDGTGYAGGTIVKTADVTKWISQTLHAATVNGIPVVQLHENGGVGGINAPLNFEDLSIVDTTGLVAVPATQKVDVETIKTRAITCGAAVTVRADVGHAGIPGAENGAPYVAAGGLKIAQTVDLTASQSIACSDKTGFSLSATGADLILKTSTFAVAIAAAINELATYGLTALNTLLVTTGIKAAEIPTTLTAADIFDHDVSEHATVDTFGAAINDILAHEGDIHDTDIPAVKTVVDLIEDILRNQLEITDANGNAVLRADNSVAALYTVAAYVTDDATTTIRKRLV